MRSINRSVCLSFSEDSSSNFSSQRALESRARKAREMLSSTSITVIALLLRRATLSFSISHAFTSSAWTCAIYKAWKTDKKTKRNECLRGASGAAIVGIGRRASRNQIQPERSARPTEVSARASRSYSEPDSNGTVTIRPTEGAEVPGKAGAGSVSLASFLFRKVASKLIYNK